MKQKDVLSERKQTCKNVLEKLIQVRKIFHLPLSEQMFAKGLVIVTCECPRNIHILLIWVIQGWKGGEAHCLGGQGSLSLRWKD